MLVIVFFFLFSSLLFTLHSVSSTTSNVNVMKVDENNERLCRAEQYDPFSDVIQLTEDNFHLRTSANGEIWLVEL